MKDYELLIQALVSDGFCDEDDLTEHSFVWTTQTTDDFKKNASDWKDINRGWIKASNVTVDRILGHQYHKGEARQDLYVADFGDHRLVWSQ